MILAPRERNLMNFLETQEGQKQLRQMADNVNDLDGFIEATCQDYGVTREEVESIIKESKSTSTENSSTSKNKEQEVQWTKPGLSRTDVGDIPSRAAEGLDAIKLGIAKYLKNRRVTLEAVSQRFKVDPGLIKQLLSELEQEGQRVETINNFLTIRTDVPVEEYGRVDPYYSHPDNTYKFGIISDTHLGSRYERLDVVYDLFDRFKEEGVDRVFHAGNYIDGMRKNINMWDVHTHSIDGQVDYLVNNWPNYGIPTYAVSGDDHEGWWVQDNGLDIGHFTEQRMRESGRDDWHNLGYMEAYVPMVNANSGAKGRALIMHPGGGSAYAISHKPQKIVESLPSGTKPDIMVLGHYHKMSLIPIRAITTIQAGCTQDQSPFMRKKNIEPYVGGWIIEAEQDPETGRILRVKPEMITYYSMGYYNEMWNPTGQNKLEGKSTQPVG